MDEETLVYYQDGIEETTRWLNERRDDYQKAIDGLSDVPTVKQMMFGILDRLESALAFNFKECTDAEAYAVIAKLQCDFSKLLTRMSLIEEYEHRSEELLVLSARVEALRAGERGADLGDEMDESGDL